MALSASQLQPGQTHTARIVEDLKRTQIVQYAGASGDYNPLHADPASAELAGFPRPVLHGLCTYGMACRALVEAVAVPRALEVRSFSSRFVAPVFPGETLVTDFWQLQPGRFALRCRVAERDVVVLNGGQAELAPAAS